MRGVVDGARELVARFGSPLYVYETSEIERRYESFVAAFDHRPFACHYAIVCNKNPVIVRRLHELGAGIHANTPGDAYAAMRAGVPSDDIVYSGTNLDESDFDFLLGTGVRMNLDSLDQLRDFARRRPGGAVGLRVLIDAPTKRNRIGVDPAELPRALREAQAAQVRITGVHMYAGTNTRRVSRFLDCLDRLLEAAATLPDLEEVDIGGGYGIGYRGDEADLDLRAVGSEVSDRMRAFAERAGRPIRLVTEPGRTLVASAGSLLVTVVSVKRRGGRRFVGVDSTVGNIVVPSVYHVQHTIQAVGVDGPPLDVPTDVCGNTTHSGDFLAKDVRLPELSPGDVVALRDVGAYAYAMSSHFLNRPRPAEVVVDRGEPILTTRREGFADLVSLYEPALRR